MEKQNLSNKISSDSKSAAEQLKSSYKKLLDESAELFPKVDQKLLLDILYFETNYKDWEGSVLLKIVYSSKANIDSDKKKEQIYEKYQKIADFVLEDRALRVKLVRMYINNLEELTHSDSDIEFISGSATLTPSDSYSA
jgi:hypothetical protein